MRELSYLQFFLKAQGATLRKLLSEACFACDHRGALLAWFSAQRRRQQSEREGKSPLGIFTRVAVKDASNYFIRNTILPLVASYGENSMRTRSPGNTRI